MFWGSFFNALPQYEGKNMLTSLEKGGEGRGSGVREGGARAAFEL